jgi:hypothetical protein
LTANITIGGTATSGVDYTALSTTVNFAAGSATATKTVSVINGTGIENDETVTVKVVPGTGYGVGIPSKAMVKIIDDDGIILDNAAASGRRM